MNYEISPQILEKIKASNNVLLNCHHNPDADSVGSALATARVLKQFGKNVRILSSTKVPRNLEFLLREEQIEVVDFNQINYSEFDLFITNDSSSWARVAGSRNSEKPEMFFINIDHHKTNQKFGDINLIVEDEAANCQILFNLFKDFEINLTEEIAEPLLAGIIGDTGVFRFPEADEATFKIADELMKLADKNKIVFNLYQSYEESHVKVWQEIMKNLIIDKENKFVYSFIDKNVMAANGFPDNAKAEISDMIFQSIEGTNFGMVGAEAQEGYISVSFRARNAEADVSVLASRLGGGGHKWAAAARVDEGDYNKSVEKILNEARNFTK